jgi:subtilisin-like proprotein convertase family protein
MPDSDSVYTYRGGQRLVLKKEPDQFVVRATPGRVAAEGLANPNAVEELSPTSSRVATSPETLDATMAASREIAPTHHAYTVAESGQEFLITDRVMVTFKQAMSPEALGAFAGKYGLRPVEAYSDIDYLFALTNDTGMNPVKLVVALIEQEQALVQNAENDLNYRAKRYAFTVPTDPAYARQWHLHAYTHQDVDPRVHVRCEDAWRSLDSYGSADVVIGVTDDGCKLDHPDFDTPLKFAGWAYFTGSTMNKRGDAGAVTTGMYESGNDHGTSCNGVIGGEVDALNTVGAAPGCQLWPVKWQTTADGYLAISDSKVMTMLTALGDKVDVLSNSWGGVPTTLWGTVVVNRIRTLAQTGGRRGLGIVFLWAAGNENCPIHHQAAIKVPYTWGWEQVAGAWKWVGVETTKSFENNLVGIPGVMHVAALASTAQRSHYSNYGTGMSVCAPTDNGHEYDRMTVRGLGITTTTGKSSLVINNFGGTSSATPLTAAVAGLVISANPALTALEVVSVLQSTASRDLSMQGYPRTPAANYDPTPTWDVSPVAPFDNGAFQNIGSSDGTWSPWFGHGRVDAAAAVAEAKRRIPGGGGNGGGIAVPVQTISQSSSPSLAIPDNTIAGVTTVISIAQAGRIARLTIAVDIEHTFVGDLRVSVTSPGNKTVVLHDRAGGSQRNLAKSYRSEDLPALAALAGDSAQGSWSLHVMDAAAQDIGKVRKWSVQADLDTGPAPIRGATAPGAAIPDNAPAGVSSTIAIAQAATVRSVKIGVDITHGYIGDLQVELTAPTGQAVLLHDRTGQGQDNLIRSYESATTPGLAALSGKPAQGNWTLKVKDLASADVGKLNRWSVEIGV